MDATRRLWFALGTALALIGAGCGGGSTGTTAQCKTADTCPGVDDFCKARTCDAGKCGFSYTAEGTALPTQTAGTCQKIVCDGSGASVAVTDDTNLPVDGNDCTDDICTGGVPSNPPLPAETSCGTGLKCDGHGACVGCVAATDCPGSDTTCRWRTCDSSTCGFAKATDGTTCDDGDPNTTGDVCTAGVCAGVDHCVGVVCTAQDQCHVAGTCIDHATGACSNPAKADGTTCDDGNPDTTGDVCTGGVCAGVDHCVGVVCAAQDQCHDAGTCDHATGVCSNPAKADGTTCDDGNPSTTGDVCTGGVCAGVDHCVGVVCTAQDQCHVAGTCIDHATGACSNPAKANGTACDDGNPNTTGDVCTAGVCAGVDHCVGVVCAAQDQCHVAGTCIDHATGACSNPAKADGTTCDDGNPNTTGDVCTGGVCAGVDHCVGVVCAAQDQCHDAGTCDHATGACSNPAKADGTTCDDGNPNTTGDVCTGGVCAGVDHCVGVVCAAQDQCHVAGTCIDHATGACSNPAQQDGTACSGPNLCTAYACATGACVGTPVGAGALCGSGLACDNAGVCHGPPNVVSVTPADGGSALADTTVVVTFDQPMDATTLTLQQGVGACTGAIQVSLDNFSTCMGFNAATPAMSSGGTVATITPAPGLLINRTYSVRVTTAATGINQLAMVAAYSQTSGFVTSSPIVGDGQAWNEAGLPYEVNACSTAAPASISATAGTTTTIDGAVWQPGFLEADYQGLTAQVGFGPMTVNPEYQTGWTWVDAPYLASSAIGGGTDLQATYEGTITLPAAGTYWYAFRISLDGKTWTYCDSTRDDGGSGALSGLTFDFEDLSQMTSTP